MKKKSLLRGALLAAALAGATAGHAQTPPPNLIDQGNGWQRLSEALPSAAQALRAGAAPLSAQREVLLISSVDGVNGAPLSEAARALLRPDFQAAAAGVQSANSLPSTSVMIVDREVLEAVAAGTDGDLYGAYAEPDDDAASAGIGAARIGCSNVWRHRELEVLDTQVGPVNAGNDPGDGRNIRLNANLDMAGHVNVKIGYRFKKSFFCVPYAVEFEHVRAQGFISMNNSTVTATATVPIYQNKWRQELGRLFDVRVPGFVGPVPVVYGFSMPFGVGVNTVASVEAGLGMTTPLGGTYRFKYLCTLNDGCIDERDPNDPSQDSTLDFPFVDGGLDRTMSIVPGVTAQFKVKPYAFLEFVGFLYDPWFLSAGIGLEAGAPVHFWGTQGGLCGDANGNGVDNVRGAFIDINAELGLYWKYRFTGFAGEHGLDWKIGVDLFGKWKLYKSPDYTRGDGEQLLLRKNLFFQRFGEGGGYQSPFSPVIDGESSLGVGVTRNYGLRMRSCLPFTDAATFEVNWADGSAPQTLVEPEGSNGQRTGTLSKPRSWSSAGQKNVTLKLVRDSAGREFGSTTTTRGIQVNLEEAPAVPANPAVGKSGMTVTFSWGSTANTGYYRVQRKQVSATAWSDQGTVNHPSHQLAQTFTSSQLGQWHYRVKACNNYSNQERCSGWATSPAITVGTAPATPSLSGASGQCYGMHDLDWNSVSGATSYSVYRNTTNSSAGATLITSGTQTGFMSNLQNTVYYWVKACNGAGCSGFSNHYYANYLPTCL